MAYISQETKKTLAPAIKVVLKKYGMKGSIGIDNHSSLVVNLKSGALDLCGAANRHGKKVSDQRGWQHYDVEDFSLNHFHFADWMEQIGETKIAAFTNELVAAMKGEDWYDNSDSMIDYFEIAYYLDINVGKWDKPYVYENNA